jgi:hypothetical protein
MAERRMFAKSIVDSDAFIDMPMSARLLYYDLGMRADDDGFVNSPKKIMRMIGATNDDMNILIMRKFVIEFENGVVVIKHWRIHNYIQRDRYKPTNYKEQMEQLETDENGSYRKLSAPCIQNVSTLDTQDRLGKDRLVKDTNSSADKPHGFTPPNIQDVRAYCKERGNKVDPENFWDFYQSKNWMIGKNKMKDWKAAVRTWERSESKQGNGRKAKGPHTFFNYEESGTACPKIEDIELHMEDFE